MVELKGCQGECTLRPVVIIDGLTSSGSSSVASRIAQTLDLKHYSSGKLYRQLCIEMGHCPKDLKDPNFESAYVTFLQTIVPKHPDFDIKIDNKFLELVKNAKEPMIAEGRVTAALVTKLEIPVIVKVWITADIKSRVERFKIKYGKEVAKKYTDEMIAKILNDKDNLDRERYLKLYNVDIFKPELYNDIVLDTSGQTLDESYYQLINHPLFREKIKKLFDFYPDYATSIIRWKCLVCGYVYEGFVPIRMCPKCGNIDPDKFKDLF